HYPNCLFCKPLCSPGRSASNRLGVLCGYGESDVIWPMDRKDTGAKFHIIIEGKIRSYRDVRETALEAGMFLKERQPQSEVVVRDVQNDVRTVIGWNNGSAFSS